MLKVLETSTQLLKTFTYRLLQQYVKANQRRRNCARSEKMASYNRIDRQLGKTRTQWTLKFVKQSTIDEIPYSILKTCSWRTCEQVAQKLCKDNDNESSEEDEMLSFLSSPILLAFNFGFFYYHKNLSFAFFFLLHLLLLHGQKKKKHNNAK